MPGADISTRGLVQQEQAPAISIVRDVYAGTLELRKKGDKYLPMQPREEHSRWAQRLQRSVLFNGVQKTADALVGLVMRKPVDVSGDLPDTMAPLLDRVTADTRSNITAFATRLVRAVVLDGHALILIDFPRLSSEMSLADERAAAPAPIWNIIPASNIIAGRTEYIDGEEMVTDLRFVVPEVYMEGYEEKVRDRIYHYIFAGDTIFWESWLKVEGNPHDPHHGEWVQDEEGRLSGVSRIPAVMAHSGPTDTWGKSAPPLLDLALENLRHFELRSDRDKHLKIASVPIPVFSGLEQMDNEQVNRSFTVASDQAISIPTGATAMLLEPTGKALDSSRQEMQDIEKRMAALGLSLLQRSGRAAETAEAHRIDAAHGSAALTSIARSVEVAINQALKISAEWMGVDPESISPDALGVNKEFGTFNLDANMIREMIDMVAKGHLSLDTMWAVMLRGEILPPAFSPEAERDSIEMDIEAGAAMLNELDDDVDA